MKMSGPVTMNGQSSLELVTSAWTKTVHTRILSYRVASLLSIVPAILDLDIWPTAA